MRMLWLAKTLRDAGLRVVEAPGWVNRGRDNFYTGMNPKVVIAHHTATTITWPDSSVENLLINGRRDLPGPLSQLGLRRDGTYVVIASGIAYHAGQGSWQGVSGNKHAIGIEAYNSGQGEPWPQVQLDAYDRGVAAILYKLRLPSSALCAHREWAPQRKIDPTGIDMVQMRARVAQLIRLEHVMNQLTEVEIDFLKKMIEGIFSVNSNSDFARTLILDYRQRKAST